VGVIGRTRNPVALVYCVVVIIFHLDTSTPTYLDTALPGIQSNFPPRQMSRTFPYLSVITRRAKSETGRKTIAKREPDHTGVSPLAQGRSGKKIHNVSNVFPGAINAGT
jgi:hypothetical protein